MCFSFNKTNYNSNGNSRYNILEYNNNENTGKEALLT